MIYCFVERFVTSQNFICYYGMPDYIKFKCNHCNVQRLSIKGISYYEYIAISCFVKTSYIGMKQEYAYKVRTIASCIKNSHRTVLLLYYYIYYIMLLYLLLYIKIENLIIYTFYKMFRNP